MTVHFGNTYVTRQPIDAPQWRLMKNRFQSHLTRGSIAMYAEPHHRAVIVTPYTATVDGHAEDHFIRQVLQEAKVPFETLF